MPFSLVILRLVPWEVGAAFMPTSLSSWQDRHMRMLSRTAAFLNSRKSSTSIWSRFERKWDTPRMSWSSDHFLQNNLRMATSSPLSAFPNCNYSKGHK